MGKVMAFLGLAVLGLLLLGFFAFTVWLLVASVIADPIGGLIFIGILGFLALMVWTAAYFMDE